MVIYDCTYVHVKDYRQKVETKSKLTGEIIIQQTKNRKDEVILKKMMKVKKDAEGGKRELKKATKKKMNLYFVAASCFRLIFSQFSFIYFPHEKDIDRQHNSKSERAFLNSIPFFV